MDKFKMWSLHTDISRHSCKHSTTDLVFEFLLRTLLHHSPSDTHRRKETTLGSMHMSRSTTSDSGHHIFVKHMQMDLNFKTPSKFTCSFLFCSLVGFHCSHNTGNRLYHDITSKPPKSFYTLLLANFQSTHLSVWLKEHACYANSITESCSQCTAK